jgi:hypothetical protein
MSELGQEIQRRESNTDKLLRFFLEHPLVWIQPKHGLEQAGGRYAWRSRLPKVRRKMTVQGLGVVEWNGINGEGTAYMFKPYRPLGRDASTIVVLRPGQGRLI